VHVSHDLEAYRPVTIAADPPRAEDLSVSPLLILRRELG
jgi:hypothetical protein